jgi:hypothetical protein
MKTFKIQCRIQGQQGSCQVNIGKPAQGLHPLKYQAAWLRETQDGEIALDVMIAFSELHAIAQEQGAFLEELCEKVLAPLTPPR